MSYAVCSHVAGRHPLKQGLKLVEEVLDIADVESRRAASTKTRIETKGAY